MALQGRSCLLRLWFHMHCTQMRNSWRALRRLKVAKLVYCWHLCIMHVSVLLQWEFYFSYNISISSNISFKDKITTIICELNVHRPKYLRCLGSTRLWNYICYHCSAQHQRQTHVKKSWHYMQYSFFESYYNCD